jgi:hypothetical protein
MKIMDILVRDAVVLDLSSRTKGDVLTAMASRSSLLSTVGNHVCCVMQCG